MKWIKVSDELPSDDLRVLLIDKNGYICIGHRDQYGYSDDKCDQLYNIIMWAYLSDIEPPTNFPNAVIATDEAAIALHRKCTNK